MKSLYYLSNKQGIKVFLYNNVLLGTTTGYSLRPNGTKEKISGNNILNIHIGFIFNKLEYVVGRIVTLNIELTLP